VACSAQPEHRGMIGEKERMKKGAHSYIEGKGVSFVGTLYCLNNANLIGALIQRVG
jgi:hypothetical protein